jgi:hypothetical protein
MIDILFPRIVTQSTGTSAIGLPLLGVQEVVLVGREHGSSRSYRDSSCATH